MIIAADMLKAFDNNLVLNFFFKNEISWPCSTQESIFCVFLSTHFLYLFIFFLFSFSFAIHFLSLFIFTFVHVGVVYTYRQIYPLPTWIKKISRLVQFFIDCGSRTRNGSFKQFLRRIQNSLNLLEGRILPGASFSNLAPAEVD